MRFYDFFREWTRRIRLAWRFKVCPWNVRWQAVRYLSLSKVTEADIKRTRELAERFGWK